MSTELESIPNKVIVHIGIDFPDNAPNTFIEKVTENLTAPGLVIKVNKRPPMGVMASLEWTIPTAIAAYLLKPYFDGFLKEAGKDHYIILKNWCKSFIENGRSIKIHKIIASQSTNKHVGQDIQSRAVSLLLQTKNGKIIKLLFDNDLSKEDWENAIEQFFDFAIDNYDKFPNDKLTHAIIGLEEDTRLNIYAIINRKTKQLQFYDDKGLLRLHNDQKNKQNFSDNDNKIAT